MSRYISLANSKLIESILSCYLKSDLLCQSVFVENVEFLRQCAVWLRSGSLLVRQNNTHWSESQTKHETLQTFDYDFFISVVKPHHTVHVRFKVTNETRSLVIIFMHCTKVDHKLLETCDLQIYDIVLSCCTHNVWWTTFWLDKTRQHEAQQNARHAQQVTNNGLTFAESGNISPAYCTQGLC